MQWRSRGRLRLSHRFREAVREQQSNTRFFGLGTNGLVYGLCFCFCFFLFLSGKGKGKMESVLMRTAVVAAVAAERPEGYDQPWRQHAGMVRQGTCGWSDESLVKCGRFYPSSLTPTQKLSFYSRHGLFSCVEVDTSAYAIPTEAAVRGWCDQVPPGFLFHIKAFSLFCAQNVPLNTLPREVRHLPSMYALVSGGAAAHQGGGGARVSARRLPADALNATWSRFNAACLQAQRAGKMGVVLFQFQVHHLQMPFAWDQSLLTSNRCMPTALLYPVR